jgi:hypothetical protein
MYLRASLPVPSYMQNQAMRKGGSLFALPSQQKHHTHPREEAT